MANNNPRPWYRRSDGWWYLTRRVNGRREQIKLAHGKDNEAEANLRCHALLAAAGHAEPAPDIGFNELAARFLAHSQRENAADTTAWYAHFLDGFDRSYEGRVTDLKNSHVEAWLAGHPDWSRSTRRQAITAIRHAVKWRFEKTLLTDFPIGLLWQPVRGGKRPAAGGLHAPNGA